MVSVIFLGGAGPVLMATFVSADGGYLSILPGMLAMGSGMGLAMTPSTEAVTGERTPAVGTSTRRGLISSPV